MPIDQPKFIERQRENNPEKLSLKLKLMQFLVTKLGTAVAGITSATVTALLAFLAVKLGVDLRENVELTGALLLFINQILWGAIQWAVQKFEFPLKQELQRALGGNIQLDGLIGPQTVKRAELVRAFADSNTPLPTDEQ